MPAQLHHVTLTASDFAASVAFYDAALEALGLGRTAEFGDEEEADAVTEAAGWSRPGEVPLLWLVAGEPATEAAHICLRADDRLEVEAFFAAALAHGGRAHDPPRRWTLYRRGEYGALVIDPDGNLVEVVAAE